jgi:multiple sugar transport system permease protein
MNLKKYFAYKYIYIKKICYPYLFILPTLFIIVVVLIYPLFEAFRISLYSYSLSTNEYIGLKNYYRLFSDPLFLESFKITSLYTLIVVTIEFLLGLGLALLLNRELKGRNIILTIILMPLILTPVIVGLLWRFMYNPDFGIINYFLSLIGLPEMPWIASASTALISAAITDIWEITPYPTILFLAGLQNIPLTLYEAAELDGASSWQKFKNITLPGLMPLIILYLIIRTSDAFQVFDIIFTLTGGGPGGATRTLSIYIYTKGWRNFELGYASAASYILVAFSAFFAIIYTKILRTKIMV